VNQAGLIESPRRLEKGKRFLMDADTGRKSTGETRLENRSGFDLEPRSRFVLLSACILFLTFLAYLPALHAGFLDWDDRYVILDNPVMKTVDGLYSFWFKVSMFDYLPLTFTSFWIEYHIWGDNPLPYHLANILLHAISAILFWRILKALRIPGAFLAGAIFAVHPVAVMSVAWIIERKNTLSMILFLLSIFTYLRFERSGLKRWYVTALILFVAAILAKASVVMLPLVLLLLAWWQRGVISRQDVIRSGPFFLVALLFGLVTVWYQAVPASNAGLHPEGIASRIAASGWIVWFYLSKLIVPVRLVVIYPRWLIDGSKFVSYIPLLLLAGLAVMCWRDRKAWGRAPLFALGYFLITLAPVLGFVDMAWMRNSLVSDHLQYVSMLGPIALFAAATQVTFDRMPSLKIPIAIVVLGLVAVLGTLTWRHAQHFRNDLSLWTHTVALNESATLALNNLAWILALSPDPDVRDGPRAVELAQRACADAHYLNPQFLNTLAAAQASTGRFDLAVKTLQRAIAIADRARMVESAQEMRGLLRGYERGEPHPTPAILP